MDPGCGGGGDERAMLGQRFLLVADDDFRYGPKQREFGSHLENIIPDSELVKLIASDGRVYSVEVIKVFYESFPWNGWEEFVDATDIQEGDSVMFVYDGNLSFKVHIFNRNGQEKSLFRCQPPTGIFGAVPSSTLCDHRVMNGHEAHKANERPSINLEVDSEPLSNNHEMSSMNSELPSGIFGAVPSTNPCDPVLNGNEEVGSAPLSNNLGGPSQCSYVLDVGVDLPTPMKKRVEEKVQAIGSEIPIYVKQMARSNILGTSPTVGAKAYHLTFCRGFSSKWLPGRNSKIHLELEDGRGRWPTTFSIQGHSRHGYIYSGWKEFVHDNGLKVGDVCLFQAKKTWAHTLTVYVIRGEL